MRLSLLLQSRYGLNNEGEYLAILECSRRQAGDSHWSPAVHVRRLYGDQFARTQAHMIETVPTPQFEQQSETGTRETVFIKQKPVVPIPDFMISFDNLKSQYNPEALTWVVDVYPPTSWDKESGVLLSKSGDLQTPVGLIRLTSLALDVCLDLVVGLERHREGVWKHWSLQRLAPKHVSMKQSFRLIRADNISFFTKSPNQYQWQPEIKVPVQIEIHEQNVHGRLSFLIKALTSMELPEETVDPPSPFFIGGVRGSNLELERSRNKTTTLLPVQLQDLLGDLFVKDSLDHGFSVRTSSAAETVARLRRRLEELPIYGHTEQSTMFLRWCADGDLSGFLGLLKDDPNLKHSISTDDQGLYAIHWAAAGGHTAIIEHLLRVGVSPEVQTPEGWTSMHFAALFGRFQALNWLLRHEVGDFAWSVDGSRLLGERNNVLLESPLHFAMSSVSAAEDDEELDALMELKNCLRWSGLMKLQNIFNETPMHRLAACGLNHMGRTVLWHATLGGRVEDVRLLLQPGRLQTLNTGDFNGMLPLHVACRFGHTEVVQALLEAGAWADCITGAPGLTPAHYAALFNHVGCLKVLIECGADVQRATKSEEFWCKPIHFANANNYPDVRKVLVEAGSDENDMNCTYYVVKSHRETEDRGSPYYESILDLTWFEVVYASSPRGRFLHSRFLRATRKPLTRIPDFDDDPSPVSSEDEDEDKDELFLSSWKGPVVSRISLMGLVVDRERSGVGEEPTIRHGLPLFAPAEDFSMGYDVLDKEHVVPNEETLPNGVSCISREGQPQTESNPPNEISVRHKDLTDEARSAGHTKPNNDATTKDSHPMPLTVYHELQGDTPARSRRTGDETHYADREILYTILSSHVKVHTRLNGGLDRYYKLAVEISEQRRTTGDDRGVEQLKMQRDEVGTPEDAAAWLGEEPKSGDEDSAMRCTVASGILERNQAAVVENSDHWVPADESVIADMFSPLSNDGRVGLETGYEGNAKVDSGEEMLLEMWLSTPCYAREERGTLDEILAKPGG
ncbi:hypothetical protein PG991_010483 [Apiospora marii]|uniref:Uncharacterized protein n=1 Tax=Apiospora marii TaxID=335849 RepID=A0ABR1RIW7_9PEZI